MALRGFGVRVFVYLFDIVVCGAYPTLALLVFAIGLLLRPLPPGHAGTRRWFVGGGMFGALVMKIGGRYSERP